MTAPQHTEIKDAIAALEDNSPDRHINQAWHLMNYHPSDSDLSRALEQVRIARDLMKGNLEAIEALTLSMERAQNFV